MERKHAVQENGASSLSAQYSSEVGGAKGPEHVASGLVLSAGTLSHITKLASCTRNLSRPNDAKRHYKRFLEMWKNADEGLPQPKCARERVKVLKRQI